MLTVEDVIGLEIDVTSEDIRNGRRGALTHCPVSVAANRCLRDRWPNVVTYTTPAMVFICTEGEQNDSSNNLGLDIAGTFISAEVTRYDRTGEMDEMIIKLYDPKVSVKTVELHRATL